MSRSKAAPLIALATAALLVLSGCSSSSQESETSGAAVASEAAADPEGQIEVRATDAWLSWTPTTVPEPKTYTPEQAAQLRLDWLERNRPDAAEGLPVPALIAWSFEDDSAIAKCMTEAGFDTRQATPAGGLHTQGLTDSQRSQYEIASWECWAKYTQIPPRLEDSGEKETRVWFEYFRDFYLDCLKTNFDINLSRDDIPSEDSWVADSLAHRINGDSWYPPNPLSWPTEEEKKLRDHPEWEVTCPDFPPSHLMNGTWANPIDPADLPGNA